CNKWYSNIDAEKYENYIFPGYGLISDNKIFVITEINNNKLTLSNLRFGRYLGDPKEDRQPELGTCSIFRFEDESCQGLNLVGSYICESSHTQTYNSQVIDSTDEAEYGNSVCVFTHKLEKENYFTEIYATDFNCHIFTQEGIFRSEEHTSELQSRENLVCRLL